jgi:hypothetical protein
LLVTKDEKRCTRQFLEIIKVRNTYRVIINLHLLFEEMMKFLFAILQPPSICTIDDPNDPIRLYRKMSVKSIGKQSGVET